MNTILIVLTAIFVPSLLSNLTLGKWAGKSENCCRWIRVLAFSTLQFVLTLVALLIGSKFM